MLMEVLSRSGEIGDVGVVCRDENGNFLGASTIVYQGLIDPSVLEATTCSEGLALTADMNIQRIHIASNYQEVIKGISNPNLRPYSVVLKEIETGRNQFWKVQFHHERREFNGEAHSLAKAVTSLRLGRHVWFQNPPDFICIPLVIEQ